MPLSWNEIRSRAVAFSKEWAGESREQAEVPSVFWKVTAYVGKESEKPRPIDPCMVNDRGRSPVPWRNPLDPRIDHAKIDNAFLVFQDDEESNASLSTASYDAETRHPLLTFPVHWRIDCVKRKWGVLGESEDGMARRS